jgi:hypothetical protein
MAHLNWKEQAGGRSKPKKVLDHLEVKEAENGGHTVTHHFTSYEHAPEVHAFGPAQGEEAMLHIAKNANIAEPVKDEQAKEHEEAGANEVEEA